MVKRKELLQHFPLEEREFAEKMLDLCQQVDATYSYRLTRFLNPKQESIVESLANHFGLAHYSSRAFLQTELSRMIVAPDYYLLDSNDFEIQALRLTYPRKFHTLSHSQVLGTLLNQLGIDRQFLGDILLGEEEMTVLLDQKFASLTLNSVSKIARVPVTWQPILWTNVQISPAQDIQVRDILVTSLRLDKLVAAAFNLSRTLAVNLVETGQVKLDYTVCKQVAKTVEIGQLLSVRRYGRLSLIECLGYSRQGKIKLRIEMIRK